MIHKMPLRRQTAATQLASDLKRFGPEVAKALEPRMAAVLREGEEMPDLAHLLDVLGRMVVHESEQLKASQRRRSQEGSGVIGARRELRERLAPELRARVIWVRGQMQSSYGAAEANRMLQHRGRTPRALEELVIMAENMVSFLPIVEPPKPKPGSPVVPADWAEYIRPVLVEVRQHLKEHGEHSRNRVQVVGRKNRTMAAFDRTYRKVIRLGELFLELVGEEQLARLLRSRRGGRPAEQTSARSAGTA